MAIVRPDVLLAMGSVLDASNPNTSDTVLEGCTIVRTGTGTYVVTLNAPEDGLRLSVTATLFSKNPGSIVTFYSSIDGAITDIDLTTFNLAGIETDIEFTFSIKRISAYMQANG